MRIFTTLGRIPLKLLGETLVYAPGKRAASADSVTLIPNRDFIENKIQI